MTQLSLVDYRKWAQSIITKPSFLSHKVGSAKYDHHPSIHWRYRL